MTNPNYYPSDVGYHVIGWYEKGRYLSIPTKEVADAFLTICAKACTIYNVGIAAWALMSSHPHIFVFDKNRNTPSEVWRFKQYVNGVFAKWLNWYRSTSGKVFDPNVVAQQFAILDVEEEASTCAYIESNLVAAGILDPDGVFDRAVSKREYLFQPLRIERPKGWFQERTWPEVAEIQLDIPPLAVAEGHTRESWWYETQKESYLQQWAALEKRHEEGKPIRTAREVMSEDPLAPRKRKINHSRVLCAGRSRSRKARYYLSWRRFLRAYRRAIARLTEGAANVLFPYGTCRMACTFGMPMNAGAG